MYQIKEWPMCAVWSAVIDFLDAFVRAVWTKTEHKLNKYIYIFFFFFLRQHITTLCLASRYFKVFYSTSACYKPLSRISLMATHHLNTIKISQKAAAHFIAVIGTWNLQTFYGSLEKGTFTQLLKANRSDECARHAHVHARDGCTLPNLNKYRDTSAASHPQASQTHAWWWSAGCPPLSSFVFFDITIKGNRQRIRIIFMYRNLICMDHNLIHADFILFASF